jgi:tRNA 2-thiouridine synthesizing protein A
MNEIGVMSNYDLELDASGLNCPLPLLKTKKALASMQKGQTLRVIATDPWAPADFVAFTTQTGHTLLESSESEGKYYLVLKKA